MIKISGVRKVYASSKITATALSGVDLLVEEGSIFGLIGHSGAGKSTLLRCINLLERPTEGTIEVAGVALTDLSANELRWARRGIGMIFQNFNLLSSATVSENIALPLRLWGEDPAVIARRTQELVDRLGLGDHQHKYPSQLSGGQKQRVGIGRALCHGPRVLLCDEATSALDPPTTDSILELLRDIHRELALTIVVVTHEMSVIRDLCDHVAILDQGKVIEQGRVENVFLAPKHPVARGLVGESRKLLTPPDIAARYARMSPEERNQTTVLYVSVLGGGVLQPILCDLVAREPVRFNILEGLVSSLKGTSFGQLLLELRADTEVLQRAVQWLNTVPGVHVDVLL